MRAWDYQCLLEVRDYEIDLQGIVHHSVYLNYLEHCRNMYVNSLGVDIHQYHQMGYDIVVVHAQQDYRLPLRPRDKFYVTLRMVREGRVKIIFDQEIRRQSDGALILSAHIIAVCVNRQTGRACMPEMLANIFK